MVKRKCRWKPRAEYQFWLDEFGRIQAECTRCKQLVETPELPNICPYCGAIIWDEIDEE